MTAVLTHDGYEQTRAKLKRLEQRLAALGGRSDLSPVHLREVQGSYSEMIRQYRREIKLYEASSLPAGSKGDSQGTGSE